MLLLACSAAPSAGSPVADQPALEQIENGPLSAPSTEQVQEDIEADERAQDAKERWLESEEAVHQREESRQAFVDISASQAEGLLSQFFPEQLAALNADPARLLTDLENVEALGTHAALVSDKQGERSLLESSIPVESEVGQDSKQPLDLTLERSGESFTPRNPLAELSLPDSALGTVRLDSGVEIGLPASADSQARSVEDVGLIYPETEKATDTILAPITGGVEVFQQLRSPDSPEVLRFDLDLPAQTTLVRTEAGGAEVVSASKERIVSIPPPWAADAQGSPVPVAMSVEGSSLALEVAHRSRDLAYPILVDPAVIEENAPFGNWSAWWNDQYNLWNSPVLGAQAKGSSYSYAGGSYGYWVWTTHGATTYISAAGFGGDMFTLPANCAGEAPTNYPYGYAGLYNSSTGGYTGLGYWYGGSSWTQAYWATGGTPGVRQAVMGMAAGPSAVKHKCAFTFEVAGVTVQQKDPEAPTIHLPVSGVTGDWVKDISVTPYVSDPGLGVTGITLSPEGAAPYTIGSCAGTYANQCPAGRDANFGVGYFAEGERGASISAYDPLGASPNSDPNHVSASYQWTTRLDRTKPEVELEGQLTEAIEEAEGAGEESAEEVPQLRLPVYNLKIAATDKATTGNPKTEAKARRSGVKDIAVFVDGVEKEVPWSSQGCSGPEYSCPMEEIYPLYLNTLGGDPVHNMKVVVEDQVGNAKERELEFEYIPATGMKDEYVMHYFPLPDGEGNEAEEEHPIRPELAVNVINGNLVYRQKDVDVEGAAVDLEVERFYNSLLPDSQNTEWGEGWTLSQTPTLEPEGGESPSEATMVTTSGVVQSDVELPTKTNEEVFDPQIQATVTKEPSGGYEVADESGETDDALAFYSNGDVNELRTSGEASVDYSYKSGNLSKLAVEDPASFGGGAPNEGEEAEEEKPTFASSFGSYGNGQGQFYAPKGVAVDPTGNVWVADTANHRIEEFGSEGTFIRQVGSFGYEEGQFYAPSGIAADPSGNVWVADTYNSRIQEFNSKGEFLRQAGYYGSGEGELYGPEGIATDAKGNVWVADTYNNRIVEFSPTGAFIRQLGEGLNYPAAISIDEEGDVWVADTGNNRVVEFDPEGELIRQFGSEGSGEGQFYSPAGISIDPKGNVWVADTYNNRVEGFTPEGEYLDQFGSEGSGEGQFQAPAGLAADTEGNLWVADRENNRIQRWVIPHEQAPTEGVFMGDFGTKGAEAGQYSSPRGVAADAEGNVWVADTSNNRIQELGKEGEFIRQFGSLGTGNGQFSGPIGIAIDPEGNVWVADTSNNRIQEFDPEGNFIRKFGSQGTGNGQFSGPRGIAADPSGNIWVLDTSNKRVQEFDSEGNFIRKFGSQGSGNGQFFLPLGIATDSHGNVWVADSLNKRLQEFNSQGEYVRQIATTTAPTTVAGDRYGNVWARVGNHIEGFSAGGKSLGQFGTEGSGESQFSAPNSIASDPYDNLWLADTGNNRVQRWRLMPPGSLEEEGAEEDDPAVEVDVSGGLVESVEGEEAGEHVYEHEGQLLTAYEAPEGETTYEYDDEEGRMTKVSLPSGTWGEVKYDEAGRVKSVTVDPAGEAPAKTTYFSYKEEPRRTTVDPEGKEPAAVYDIGADGSVLKWWNTESPPEIQLTGSLYQNKETAAPIEVGDYELEVFASHAEGIASIEIVANGNELVSEKACEEDHETEAIECDPVEDLWVTNTGNWSPGIVYLEVVVTDANDNVESARFWVNVPYTPPPDPEAEEAPKFEEVLEFREEFGLDLDLNGNEKAIAERVFNLIGAWHNPHTPAGEIARATWERWGVPLRAVDAAELDYRNWYIEVNGPIIDEWGYSHYPATYAGYIVDHRAGGLIRIGFTTNQEQRVGEIIQAAGMVAVDRFTTFSITPTQSRMSLESLESEVVAAMNTDSQLSAVVNTVGVSDTANVVSVGATNVSAAATRLSQLFGGSSAISVAYEPDPGEVQSGRDRQAGRMLAGDRLWTDWAPADPDPIFTWGTTGFGAYEPVYDDAQGKWLKKMYLLTAGHMGNVGSEMYRFANLPKSISELKRAKGVRIGQVERNAVFGGSEQVDAAAMRYSGSSGRLAPHHIFGNNGSQPPISRSAVARKGEFLCTSGARTEKVKCGYVVGIRYHKLKGLAKATAALVVDGLATRKGDSGAPVWHPNSGKAIAVGIVSGGYEHGRISYVQPLFNTPDGHSNVIAGALDDPQIGNLRIATVK